jgi:membrane protein YqaA with SNARE-associated domain
MRSSIKVAIVAAAVILIAFGLLKVFNIAGTQFFSDAGAFFANYGIVGIFFLTIISGTMVPLGSPAIVAATAFFVNPVLLVLVATIGYTIGLTINYTLAYCLGRPYVQKRIAPKHIEEMTNAWNKWGWLIYTIFGLVPVLPVEPLAFICGCLKARIVIFLTLSFVPRLILFSTVVYLIVFL